MSSLLTPVRIGDLDLPNRIVMAPLTRTRSDAARLPNALMAAYYAQRASAGLILSEATVVCARGAGYANTPGIWSSEQAQAWKLVTHAVHEAGGRIFLQLWHVGRISHSSLNGGWVPLAPSAIAPAGRVALLRPETDYEVPEAASTEQLLEVVEQFRNGARNAQAAGFDGVELHGANGYLLDQFLHDHSNRRDDDYGGSIANRARLLLQCTDAAISVWGAGRVGVHLSPRCDVHDVADSTREQTFVHVAQQLGQRGIAFLCAREHTGEGRIGPQLKAAFGGSYIANEGFDQASGEKVLAAGEADAVAYGRTFIANPDLPKRFAQRAALNTPDPSTFYGTSASGYTDYPALI